LPSNIAAMTKDNTLPAGLIVYQSNQFVILVVSAPFR
jgi:hypothetical protein